ncbi:DUF302 domain-containing protein [Sulfurovum sp. ST-21]|uniref:DUF302 domain-containing protein n=1 Tax=Sulfurovum indicum TaxID=2779528 RepID=A0A7M1S6L7_9BACT|nr:DUF302 domain-containing protein [Sulfurovum indicum]QOR62804.1 DUF302 domain-containing protein [Sulfurovum indicum]
MKKWLILGLLALIFTGCENKKGAFLETVESQNDVPASVNKLLGVLEQKKLIHFATIDHAKNAKEAGMRLKPETVVVFGNPKAGTQLMECNPSIGLDLPLRMLFTTDYEGKTTITYTNPEYWTLKHNIKDKKCLGIIKKIHITLQTLAEEAAKK